MEDYANNRTSKCWVKILPFELLEPILLKTFAIKYVPVYKMLSGSKQASYTALTSVCAQWWTAITNPSPSFNVIQRATYAKLDNAVDLEMMKEQLVKHRAKLARMLECDYGLVDQLRDKLVLADADREELDSKFVPSVTFLDVMSRQSEVKQFHEFLEALRATGQSHVAAFIIQDIVSSNDDRPLSKRQTKRIEHNLKFLNCYISLDILDALVEMNGITRKHAEYINSIETYDDDYYGPNSLRTRKQKREEFVEIIQRRSVAQFKQLLKCLDIYNETQVLRVLEEDGGLTAFLNDSTVLYVIPTTGEQVAGLTLLGKELFAVRWSSEVYVYSNTDFSSSRSIIIPESQQLVEIASCMHYNCLYIYDHESKVIYRYGVTDKTTTQWPVSGELRGLSTTERYTVLIAFDDTQNLQEYTTNGDSIREIYFATSLLCLEQSVELSNGNFIVCYEKAVSIIDQQGRIIQTSTAVATPLDCAVDTHGNVLICDYFNSIHVVSRPLTYIGQVEIPGHEFLGPNAVHFDELTHRLYIGELASGQRRGRIVVIEANVNDID